MEIEFNPQAAMALRIEKNISRRKLADVIGLSQLTVTSYEQGKTIPSVRVIGRLAGALGCPIEALFRVREQARADAS